MGEGLVRGHEVMQNRKFWRSSLEHGDNNGQYLTGYWKPTERVDLNCSHQKKTKNKEKKIKITM